MSTEKLKYNFLSLAATFRCRLLPVKSKSEMSWHFFGKGKAMSIFFRQGQSNCRISCRRIVFFPGLTPSASELSFRLFAGPAGSRGAAAGCQSNCRVILLAVIGQEVKN
jgi:hypothetical protein